MYRVDPINASFDEVDIILLVNEDCNSIFDGEETIDKMLNNSTVGDIDDDMLDAMIDKNIDVDIHKDANEEVDDDVKNIVYDDQLDNATTIEDMVAQELIAARNFGYETGFNVDDDVLDILFDDDFNEQLDEIMKESEGGLIDNVVIV